MKVTLKQNSMKYQKVLNKLVLIIGVIFLMNNLSAQDQNFHIYLCFGQSNMEGQGTIENQDKTDDARFQVMETVDCSTLRRTKGDWYTATPPLCRCNTGLSPADYFGKTMIENLPDSIKVGVINVSVAGCKIELFDKDNYQNYVATAPSWMVNIINEYGGNPYAHLVEMAQLAQQDGVIKGILLHQGESNTGDNQWPSKVKGVYDNLINDLGLDPSEVPLLAGEVVNADQGGACASMNSIIAKLPQSVPNSYVISSSGCSAVLDNLHFSSEGYRELGTRYAEQMLSLQGIEIDPGETSLKWVGTWSTAPYAAENNTPPSPYLANNTLRQILRVTIGGDTLRVKFSNRTSLTPVTMNSVNIAVSKDASTSLIDTSTIKQLKFNGNETVTMDAYSEVTSDPLAFPLTPGMRLAITIYYGQCRISSDMTFHYGSRTDSYILAGNQSRSSDFSGATTVERWYHLSSIDVLAPTKSAAVAVLGNSITDGYGLHDGPNNKWTHFFADKLLDNPPTSHVSVLNLGIGATWLTSSGVTRFQKDILEQSGLRWIIIFYGVNDIGGGASAENIINAYKSLIAQAHAENVRIYGATITPFKGHYYYSDAHEAVRSEVNKWIRTPGNFDKCIDLDKAIRDPSDTTKLQAAYSNDWLHPNAAGYQFLGESINVNFFLGTDTTFTQPEIESHFFEAECEVMGDDWELLEGPQASNGYYVTVKSGVESLSEAPGSEGRILIPFSVDSTESFSVFARVNCPSYDDDSFWVKMEDGEFVLYNGLVTNGWEWKSLGEYNLSKGEHTLTIGYREDGALLDKICVTNSSYIPEGMGEEAENICDLTEVGNSTEIPTDYKLVQNYPNPFNPTTTINYSLPVSGKVSIKIYDVMGREVDSLLNEEKAAGRYSVVWNASKFASGAYFYQMISENFNATKKLLLVK